MTAIQSTVEDETPASRAALDGDTIAAEIRIVQSVQAQRNMPVLLVGLAFSIAVIAYIDWTAAVSSNAVYFLAIAAIMFLPILPSYFRLRGKPRPLAVSKRRIRRLEFSAFLLGLVWAAIIFLVLGQLNPIDGAMAITLTFSLCFGSVALNPSLPKAAITFTGLLMTATFAGAYLNDIVRPDLLIVIVMAVGLVLARTVWQNWQDVSATVRLGLEKSQSEAAAHQRETGAIRSILAAIPFPLVVTREGGVVHASEQARRQFEIPAGDLPELDIGDFIADPDDWDKMAEIQERQGRLEEYEVQLKNARGEPFWASISTLPMRYEGEDCWLNAIYVIDDRKRAEQELKEKSAVLEATFEIMGEGISMFDADLNAVALNRRFYELLGLPKDEFGVGASLESMFRCIAERGEYGPGDIDKKVATRMALMQDIEPHLYVRTRPDGTVIEGNNIPVAGGGFVTTYTDITERQRAENALTEKEAQLRLVMDHMRGGIRLVDKERNYVFFNRQYLELYDFPDGLLKIGESNRAENLHQAERGDFGPGDPAVLVAEWRDDKPVHTEATSWERTTVFGRTLQVHTSPTPGGGFVNIVTDITERKAMEEDLRESERRLIEILDLSPIAVSIISPGNERLYGNSRLADMHGLERDAMIGGGRVSAFEGEDIARLYEQYERDGAVHDFDIEGRKPDGSAFWATRSMAPIEFKGEPATIHWAYDITERKLAEAEAREKTRILELTLENMGQGLVLYDGDWNLVTNNRRYAEHFDLALDVFEGEITFDDIVAATMRQDYPDDWEERLNVVRDPSRMSEVWRREFTRPTGRALDLISNPLPGGGFVVTSTDITQRKSAEADLLEAKQQAEEQNRMLETVSNQLAKYISPQLYQAIFSGQQKVAIESKRKKLTVFFSDIAGFTEITDQLESEELTALLNQYLTEMSKIGLEHGANFDKFIGDAMMFYFGDPESKGAKEDADACLRMAIAMQHRVRELQEEWRALGVERPFEIRMGISTGYCTVGNFGSEDRMDYTIIGSEVNLAARLQSHAEVGGILLANETYALVKDWLAAEQADAITVKGFAKPVTTFRVTGIYEDLAAEGLVTRLEGEGVALTIDHERLSEAAKAEAVQTLEDALARLKE